MKNTLEIIAFIVIFGGVIALLIVNTIRRREINFEGTVIDKNIIENQNVNNNLNMMNRPGEIMMGNNMGGVTHEYKIKVKTDSGKEINYKISAGMYEIVKIGDRVSKPSGTTEINIVSTSQTPQVSQVDQSPAPMVGPPTTGQITPSPVNPDQDPQVQPPHNNNPQSFV